VSERNDDEPDLEPLDDEQSDPVSDQDADTEVSASDPDALHTEIIEANSDAAATVGEASGLADEAEDSLAGEDDELDDSSDPENDMAASAADEEDEEFEGSVAGDEFDELDDNDNDNDNDNEILNFRTESLDDELDIEDEDLDDDEDEFDDEDEVAIRRTSWWKVAGGLVAACAVFAMVAWGLGLSVTGDEASDAELAAQLPDSDAAPAQQKGEAPSKKRNSKDAASASTADEDEEESDGKKTEVKKEKQGKPPKVAIQIFDTKQGLCPDYFELSINVYVVKGQVDRGMARLTIPAEGKIRSYPLYEVQGDFSNVLRGIPTSMTANLYIRVEGPDGVTEEWHDVTHTCPGKKVDDVEKTPKQLKKEKKFTFKVPKMKDLFDKEALEALEDLGLGSKDKDDEKSDAEKSESSDNETSG
jgi:hypothetical protein